MAAMAGRGVCGGKFLVLMCLGLLVAVAFGDGDGCGSFPGKNSPWKGALPREQSMRMQRTLGLPHGSFKQGAKVLINRPADANPGEEETLRMRVRRIAPTETQGLYRVRVESVLGFYNKMRRKEFFEGSEWNGTRATGWVTIAGEGAFDEATGELCVVGCIAIACNYKLRLRYPVPSTILNLTVVGNLSYVGSAADGTHFDPVSLHGMSDSPWVYTKNGTLASACPHLGADVAEGVKLFQGETDGDDEFRPDHAMRLWESFEVVWNSECEGGNCSPFEGVGNGGGGTTSFLRFPRIYLDGDHMQGNLIVTKSRYYDYGSLPDPIASDGTLVVEGVWNSESGKMCMIACRLYGKVDCEIAITMQFPLSFTVTERFSAIGHIHSLRNETDPAYFKKITLRQVFSSSSGMFFMDSDSTLATSSSNAADQREYVYTKVETAKKFCANFNEKKSQKSSRSSATYPSGVNGRDLEFHGFKDSFSTPHKINAQDEYVSLTVFTRGKEFLTISNDRARHAGANVTGLGVTGPELQAGGILNMSYYIHYQIRNRKEEVEDAKNMFISIDDTDMAGEGVYDSETGKLCLIGCLFGDGDGEPDCQFFFRVQFPPLHSIEAINGTVTSLRATTDPLYFPPESFSGSNHLQAADSIWRLDLEIVLSVVMLSLTVVFILLQLVYSKRYSNTLPYLSTSMLLVLALAHMIPLVLNFEALFQNRTDEFGMTRALKGWPEANEVVVRLTTMAAMLLQLRLLQLVWKSRIATRATGDLSPAIQERRVVFWILPLYFLGGLVAILFHALKFGSFKFKPYEGEFLWHSYQSGLWWEMQAYAGLLVDFHLFPQVLANVLWDAKQQAPLCKPFYLGMAMVRSLPHFYDLCRRFRFLPSFSEMYMYANPDWDFYSVTADILIPLVAMLLAVMVYMQQRWGGQCVVPRRWRSLSVEYEKVDTNITT